jgi:hypothetical protein
MVSSDAGRSPASRPSNHEGGLTGACKKTARDPPISNRLRDELRERFQSLDKKLLVDFARVFPTPSKLGDNAHACR